MSDLSRIAPFRLVRRLGLGGERNPAIYLLVCDPAEMGTIEAELAAETNVQLGAVLHIETASELRANDLPPWTDGSVRLIRLDQWLPDLIDSLDRNAPVLVQDGGQLLILADRTSAERVVRRAPNLRNRLAGIFQIIPEQVSEGPGA